MRIAAVVVLAFMGLASASHAQNRDIRLEVPASAVPDVVADDFSATDMAYMRIGRWQTYYYSGFELGVRALRNKQSGDAQYTLSVIAPRLRAPGDIVSVSTRGGASFEAMGTTAGPVNCSRTSCRHTVAGDFRLPDDALAQLRAGQPVDVRISTTCGRECDIVQSIPPNLISRLDEWLASRSAL